MSFPSAMSAIAQGYRPSEVSITNEEEPVDSEWAKKVQNNPVYMNDYGPQSAPPETPRVSARDLLGKIVV